MNWKTIGLASVAVLGVAACFDDKNTAEDNGVDKTVVAGPTCAQEEFAYLLGRDKDTLDEASLPEVVRVVQDGSPVTLDLRPDRLNIWYDEQGEIVGLTCG